MIRLRDLVRDMSGAEVAMAAAAVLAFLMIAAHGDLRSTPGAAKASHWDRGQTEVYRGPRA